MEALDPTVTDPSSWDPSSMDAELGRYKRAALEVEARRGSYRTWQAWQLDLRVGVEPGSRLDPSLPRVEWIGMVTVGLSLGRLVQAFAEPAVLEARAQELRESEAELSTQVERLVAWARSEVKNIEDRRTLVETQLKLLGEKKRALAERESERQSHLLALAELDRVELEAERAFLDQLVIERRAMGGNQ
jgi:hypothetical protein